MCKSIFIRCLLAFVYFGVSTIFSTEVIAQDDNPPTSIPVPSSFTATGGDGYIDLSWSWDTANTPDGYSLQFNYQPHGGNWGWAGGENATSFRIKMAYNDNLTNGQEYRINFKAAAYNSDTERYVESSVVNRSATPNIAAPADFKATAGDSEVRLNWTAVPNVNTITDYDYSYSEDGGTNWETWATIPNSDKTTNTHTVTGLANGTQYTFKVRAVGAGGGGKESNSETATPTPSPPAAPTNLKATPGDGKVILSWDAPSGAVTGYEYKLGSGGWQSTNNGTNTTYTHTGLTNGNAVLFSIRAVNGTTKGAEAGPIPGIPTLPAPTGLTATADNGQVELRWKKPSDLNPPSGADDVTHYEYIRDDIAWLSTGSTDLSHIVTGLTNGTPYTFKVRAVRIIGTTVLNGLASDPAPATPTAKPQSLQTPPPSLGPPTNFNVETVEDTTTNTVKAILTWDPPQNAANMEEDTIGYAYRYKYNPWTPWISTNGSGPPYTVTGLEIGKTYTFEIRAFDVRKGLDTSPANNSSTAAVPSVSKPTQRVIQECPVGWIRSDGFAGRTRRALLYEVKLEMDIHNPISVYKPDWIAIYVHPDEGLENLDGWKLQVAIPYNHHREYLLTAENSVVVEAGFVEGGFAFIENPQENPFPMVGMGFTGSPVPGFDYRLYDETGKRVDFGISCYKRFDVFQVLKATEDPRVLRKVLLESFDWDSHYLRSEWTVPTPAPAAPSLIKKNIVGTWADLKKQSE